jgi:hypothetical protein
VAKHVPFVVCTFRTAVSISPVGLSDIEPLDKSAISVATLSVTGRTSRSGRDVKSYVNL